MKYMNIYTDSIVSGPFTRNILFADQDQDVEIDIYADGMVKARDMVGKGYEYILQIAIPKYRTTAFNDHITGLEKSGAEGEEPEMTAYLQIPEGFDELQSLAEELTAGLDDDLEKAETLERYFKSDFEYNEEPDLEIGKDMINEFVFEVKEGFCQQFATAMILMLRSQGIPARFVTGYVVGADQFEKDDLPEDMQFDPFRRVYDYNAHTWVEVYVQDFGWVQYEPTPGQNVIQFVDPFEGNRTQGNLDPQTAVIDVLTHDYFPYGVGALLLLIAAAVMTLFNVRGRS